MYSHWQDDALIGELLLDEVCLGNNSDCVPQYTFFGTKSDPDVSTADGILGLRNSASPGDPVEG